MKFGLKSGIFIGFSITVLSFSLFNLGKNLTMEKKVEFVKIDEAEYNVVLDIKYATKDNFIGRQFYKKPVVYLPREVAEKLKIASKYANKMGYKLKIFDGYRPLDVQRKLFKELSNEDYVSDPDKGVASHTRGMAIDLTLIDLKTGREIDMGTEFDSMSEKSNHNPDLNLKPEELRNRMILSGIMSVSQFTPLPTEWWHFNYRLYPVYPDYDKTKFRKFSSDELGLASEY